MTMDNLFGQESVSSKFKSIRFKILKPIYETITIQEKLPEYLSSKTRISSSAEVYELFKFLAQEPRENFLCIHLNSKNRIICIDRVSVGSLTASIVHPREVFSSVLLSAAAAILLCHQHPSGDPEPSREDLEITKRLKDGADLLGVRLLDHVVIGDGGYVSLADRGLI
jgi:DNA repair protein RadC